MSKWPFSGIFLAFFGLLTNFSNAQLRTASASLERAENQYVKIKSLVDSGILPKNRLDEAARELADAKDDAILAETLYSGAKVQDMTPEQAGTMLAAAERRVERQAKVVDDRRALIDKGILAKSEFKTFADELDARRQTLALAQDRKNLLDEIRQMAEVEQQLERAAHGDAASARAVMIRYGGDGIFDLKDLGTIETEFQKQFHRPLPVSAVGQTLVHQAMGLDHRNRVDVALNPDAPEGVWLRHLLERLQIPYLAFRGAIAGAATAPHIHIGPESTRLRLAHG